LIFKLSCCCWNWNWNSTCKYIFWI